MQAERNTSPAAWTLADTKAAPNKELEEKLVAAQREAAVARAAAQRSEQQRKWAVDAAVADQFALAGKECELEETEDVALFALEAYERADKQRTELYYQAKSSNALAAKTLMESLDGADGERCKALAKLRNGPSGCTGEGTSPHSQTTSDCCRPRPQAICSSGQLDF